MRKNLFSALTAFLAFLLTALVSLAQVEKAAAVAAAKKAPETAALLFEITGRGITKPSYIFGTIHVICPNDMFSMEKLNGYIDQTDQIIMEIDMDDAIELRALSGAAVIPGGKTFTEYLTPEEYAKVDAFVQSSLGMSVDKVKNLKPIILSTQLIITPKVLGCSPPSSYEVSFMQTAIAKKKPITGLETVKAQIDILDKTPLEKQAKELYKMALDPEKSYGNFRKMLAVYKAQDDNALRKVMDEGSEDNKDFAANLIDARNKAWIPQIEKLIKEKPSFIAVGGGHLGGKTGVINLLRAKGYTLTPLRLPMGDVVK